MFRRLFAITLVSLMLPPVSDAQQVLRPQDLSGCWKGTATFFNRDLAEKVGPLPVTLKVEKERVVSGHVGQGSIDPAPIGRGSRVLQVNASIYGRIAQQAELDKDRFVLLVTAIIGDTAKGEIHLKSNRVFDARVREARIQLTRADCH